MWQRAKGASQRADRSSSWSVSTRRAEATTLAPASVSHTEPSGAGTAEWISAGPGFGTRNSLISPLAGLKRAMRFDTPYCGIQKLPAESGWAVQGKRLGPGISKST